MPDTTKFYLETFITRIFRQKHQTLFRNIYMEPEATKPANKKIPIKVFM